MLGLKEIYYLAMHFLLAFVVAWLAFSLMRTIFSGVTGRGIFLCLFLAALSLSVASHILEDYTFAWF